MEMVGSHTESIDVVGNFFYWYDLLLDWYNPKRWRKSGSTWREGEWYYEFGQWAVKGGCVIEDGGWIEFFQHQSKVKG